jgi:hypothetical protein
MTIMANKPLGLPPASKRWFDRLLVPEMWGTLAISVMWLAVLFDGIYGGDILSASNDGNSLRLPSAVVVAFFAFLGTAAVAKRAFGTKTD